MAYLEVIKDYGAAQVAGFAEFNIYELTKLSPSEARLRILLVEQ